MKKQSISADPGTAVRPDRRARRREETRRKLIDAAQRLFAAKGVESTRINEITEEADVGFGSFYNYFEDKEAIVQAVLSEATIRHGERIAELTGDLDDPAELISVAHRYFVRLAGTDPEWAWLLVRLDDTHEIVLKNLGPFARRDLKRGIDEGRLQVPDPKVALVAMGGALLAVMRAVLDRHVNRGADGAHAEGVLRMLGLSAEEAGEVAARPFPAGRFG